MPTVSPFVVVSTVTSWFDGVCPLIVASRRAHDHIISQVTLCSEHLPQDFIP